MEYFLGIDGGGTKTKIIIINNKEEIIFENISGPSSIDTVDEKTTYKNIEQAIKPFISQYPNLIFKGVFVGLGGIVFDKDCKLVESLISQLPSVNDKTFIRARNDMYNALYSAGNFDYGIALICGTGMVAFGKNNQHTHKAGGWSYLEGELGSAYHLGREAIRHCIRAYDYRLDMTDFAKDIAKVIGLNKATDIIEITNTYHDERTKTARLAPIVTKHANQNNIYAKEICDKAISEIALAVKAVYKTLGFEKTHLVIIGSLGHAQGYFSDTLHKAINQVSQNINIMNPIMDPALAAAKAAKYFSEVQNDN
jgi:N-acetylglucosamine kinase-like BadF-type ATPase